jgi:hypothetical protein
VHRDQRGFTTIQYVVATGFSLLLFVLVANLLVDLYAGSRARRADEECAAVPVSSSPRTARPRREVVRSVMGGSLLRVDERLRTPRRDDRRARIALRSWLPMVVPDWHLQLRAAALPEP